MDHALTNQDLGSDEASVSRALPDDAELQRRLEACLERAIARRRRTPLLICAPILLGVLAVWWVCGVPELLYVSIMESPLAYFERIGDRTVPRATAWDFLGLFALAFSLPVLFGVFVLWMSTVHHTRSRRRLLEGVRRSGFHACPCCGADVRSDSEPNCRICREIVVDRVPPFWRQYVLEDRRFERFGGLPKSGRVSLKNRFCVVTDRSERMWYCIALICSVLFLLMATVAPASIPAENIPTIAPWVIATVVFIVLLSKRRQSSRIGFCPSCGYEQVSEDPTATCPECGTSHLIGQRVYTRLGDAARWSFFIGGGVLLLAIGGMVLRHLGVLAW